MSKQNMNTIDCDSPRLTFKELDKKEKNISKN